MQQSASKCAHFMFQFFCDKIIGGNFSKDNISLLWGFSLDEIFANHRSCVANFPSAKMPTTIQNISLHHFYL